MTVQKLDIELPKTKEEMTKEKNDAYVAALIRERKTYETRLTAHKLGTKLDEAVIANLSEKIAECNRELELVGDHREPRSKIRK